jgi:PKD repeat protein
MEKIDLHVTSDPETVITLPARGPENTKNTFFFVVDLIDNNNDTINSEEVLGGSTPSIITINGKNPAPIVDFLVDRVLIRAGETVYFNAKAEDPTGRDIPKSAYSWDFNGDGVLDDTTSGSSVSHKFDIPGEYPVRLRVNVRGVSASKTRMIYVERQKEFPYADFSTQVRGLTVAFNASSSGYNKDIPGNELEYTWDFDTTTDSNGNGIKDDDIDETGMKVSHTFAQEGSYPVQLLIENSLGEKDALRKTINIRLEGNDEDIRQSSILRSMRLTSETPMATLELATKDFPLNKDGTMEIMAFGIDIDESLITGPISFRILEGDGRISPRDGEMIDGEAHVTFFPSGTPGNVVIEATVQTSIGPLSELLSFPVQ